MPLASRLEVDGVDAWRAPLSLKLIKSLQRRRDRQNVSVCVAWVCVDLSPAGRLEVNVVAARHAPLIIKTIKVVEPGRIAACFSLSKVYLYIGHLSPSGRLEVNVVAARHAPLVGVFGVDQRDEIIVARLRRKDKEGLGSTEAPPQYCKQTVSLLSK